MSDLHNNNDECEGTEKPSDGIDLALKAGVKDLGSFSVRRTLPSRQQRKVGPWIFFDHAGPAHFNPGEGIDVRPHPHINLATVTYMFEGQFLHRDSIGTIPTELKPTQSKGVYLDILTLKPCPKPRVLV